MIKVLIVDDQELIRESLKVVLSVSGDIEVVDLVSSVSEALKSAEGTKLMKERYPKIKVVLLTTFDDDEYVFGALKNGASGYLLKGSSVSDLAKAIQIAHSGGAMINPNIASKMISQFSDMAKRSSQIKVEEGLTEDLSKSECQMIQTVGQGMSNKEIARELCLSEGTVRNSISNILSKLNLRDRTQLAIWAVQTGVIYGSMEG